MNETRKEFLRRLVKDEDLYFRRFLRIIDKHGKLIPFVLNTPQTLVKQVLDEQEASLGYIRAIILKARQEGVSTYMQGKLFHRSSLRKFRKSLVVSHELDSAEHIFGMSRLFLQELDPSLTPYTRRSNRREILFENPDFNQRKGGMNPGLRSHISVETAKDLDAGASRTLRYLHLSEVARWRNAKKILTSLLQAVPDEPDTMIVFESTAMGTSGEFHSRYWKAKSGDGDYVAVFLPWWLNPEYSIPLKPGENLDLDTEELALISQFPKITMAQLKWRRRTIIDKLNGDVLSFKQEYPSDDIEAFVGSGSRKYSVDLIKRAQTSVCEPQGRYRVEVTADDNLSLTPHRRGEFQVWEDVRPDGRYLLAGDVAEGVIDGDFSVGGIFDHRTMDQVAMYRGRVSPEEFGDICFAMGKHYNWALAGIESNGPGLITNAIMKNRGYKRMYYTKKKDEKTKERTRKLGFLTTSRTRNLALGYLGEALKEDDIKIRASEIINELMTFVIKASGKIEADEGATDDCVIMSAIACTMAVEYPPADFESEREMLRQRQRQSYRGGVTHAQGQ